MFFPCLALQNPLPFEGGAGDGIVVEESKSDPTQKIFRWSCRKNCLFCRSSAVLLFQDPAKDGKWQATTEVFGNFAHYRQRSDAHDKSKHGKDGEVRYGGPKVRLVGVQPVHLKTAREK